MKQLWYFTSGWCQPCQQLGPVMSQVLQKGISIKKVDIDYTPDVTTKFNVKSIPTVILVENGQEVRRFTGVRSFEQVMSFYNG